MKINLEEGHSMKLLLNILTVMILAMFSTTSLADHHSGLHACLKAASAVKDGYYAKLEYLTVTNRGSDVYDIEIHDKDGVEWELMCDISKGSIYEFEREVKSTADPLFKNRMKVDEKTAAQTALALYPGKLVHTEYEIETNGSASYEFDIYERPGVTYKVEVDATTGEIVEIAIEKWDIGRETQE
jgi:uncharacterized membrane protein YkoI